MERKRSRRSESFSRSSLSRFDLRMDFLRFSISFIAFLSTGCIHLSFPDFFGGPKKTIYVESESIYPSQRVVFKVVLETDSDSDGCIEVKVGMRSVRSYIRNQGVPKLKCQKNR